MRAVRILALARTSRCAMVGAGTRKARAISSVESPPSVRNVRATCASVASAGWQHVKIRRSLSSVTGVSSSPANSGADSSICRAISSCFCSSQARRRSRSIALCRPVETSQLTGFAGVPAAGHCSSPAANASWSASSATSMSPSRRISVARIRPYSARKISSMPMAALGGKATPPEDHVHAMPATTIRLLGRTLPDGPPLDRQARFHQRTKGGESEHLVQVLGLHDGVARQLLLGLSEWPIRHERFTVFHPNSRGRAARLERLAAPVEAARPQRLAVIRSFLEDLAPLLHGQLLVHLLVPVDQQHVTHVDLSTSADGWEDRDLGAIGDGRAEAPGPPAALGADEDVDVWAHLALLGDHAIAHTGCGLPERLERVVEGRRLFCHLDLDPAPPACEGSQWRGDQDDDMRHRRADRRATLRRAGFRSSST